MSESTDAAEVTMVDDVEGEIHQRIAGEVSKATGEKTAVEQVQAEVLMPDIQVNKADEVAAHRELPGFQAPPIEQITQGVVGRKVVYGSADEAAKAVAKRVSSLTYPKK